MQIRSRLTHDYEIVCLDAIQQLFDQADDIDIFNKRAIFVYVRDMTNVTQKQLSSAVSVIKKHYKDIVSKGGMS
jgi:glycerol-3-phosphate cytidylyltransferase-like family protein